MQAQKALGIIMASTCALCAIGMNAIQRFIMRQSLMKQVCIAICIVGQCGLASSNAQISSVNADLVRPLTKDLEDGYVSELVGTVVSASAEAPVGLALVVGVERLSGQEQPDLATAGSGGDARGVTEMLFRKGFSPERVTTLITEQATKAAFQTELKQLSAIARSEDLIFLYFSGHGGRQLDIAPRKDEEDGWDETLVLYDGSILDDDIYALLLRFPAGCRLVFVNDACNAGTTYKFNAMREYRGQLFNLSPAPPIMAFGGEMESKPPAAQMIYMGGSRDGESALGDEDGGRYTRLMLQFLSHPMQPRTYQELHARIVDLLDYQQQPTYEEIGPVQPRFKDHPPLTIDLQ